jgi:hypothetical protein
MRMTWRASVYQLILTFFGLNQQYRVELFSQIDEIVTYGQGYDWATVYNFPIWLRNFTYKKIEERYRKKNEAIEEQNNIVTNTTKVSNISKPPSSINQYNSKVSKK